MMGGCGETFRAAVGMRIKKHMRLARAKWFLFTGK